jgi:hypothetical protein
MTRRTEAMSDDLKNLRSEIEKISETDPSEFLKKASAAAKKHLGDDVVSRVAPFGIQFARPAPAVTAGNQTGTTAGATVTIALPPDTDTSPPDTD